jgi:hypothetical protein
VLGKVTEAVAQSGLSQGLLSSELVYVPAEDAVGDAERESGIGELVVDLEENEGTLRVWTTLDSWYLTSNLMHHSTYGVQSIIILRGDKRNVEHGDYGPASGAGIAIPEQGPETG